MSDHSRQVQRTLSKAEPIEARNASDLTYKEFLHSYVRGGRPVVIQEATPQWKALQTWTPEYFKNRFGEKLVRVSYEEEMRFSDFIDGVAASTLEKPGPYMYRLFLHEHLPEVLPDLIPQNPYAFPRRYASPLLMEYWRRPDGFLKLLIGGIGGRFPVMHFDGENAHATVTQIYGDKEFVVYAPQDTALLYPLPDRANHSSVDDPVNQDLERFPLLANARQFRTVLKPGDMMFVPCRWWHTARALTPSISVGMNLLDSSNWDGFVAEICEPGFKPRQVAKRAYLRTLGPTLSILEAVQRVFPWAARLAPDTSAVTPEPSSRPLALRMTTG